MMDIRDEKEMRMVYLSASVLGFSIIAIIFLAFGYTIIFYIVAIITVIVGYYFARSLPDQGRAQQRSNSKDKTKVIQK